MIHLGLMIYCIYAKTNTLSVVQHVQGIYTQFWCHFDVNLVAVCCLLGCHILMTVLH